MKIVVIEDEVLLAQHFKRTLERAGYTVRHAHNGLEAIDLIDEVTPDVIIADMLLTGSTIMPLLHELRSHDDLAKIPIIMVTNLAGDLFLDTLKPYGVMRLLDKATMEPDDIVAAVRGVTP